MQLEKEGIFPIDDALEMVLMFGEDGKIVYANKLVREKLEYGDELCGRLIGDVFPNTFSGTDTEEARSPESVILAGEGIRNLVAYRKNTTCFPVEARIVRSESRPGLYICMANDILEREFLGRGVERGRGGFLEMEAST